MAGDFWPWGDPHRYPHTPHPIAGGADAARGGARKLGIEMRVGPVGITNGAFGNRPHCIYRGYCLQGCKVNAKASPLVTHIPDAIEHGAEIRADCMAARGGARRRDRTRDRGRVTSTTAPERVPARRGGRGGGLFDRDAAAAAQLDQPPVPARPRKQQRPGRAVRDGAGRAAGGRPVPRGDADVQGAAAGDLIRAVLRDRPRARVRAGVLDPDGRAAADRARPARARPRALGPGAARVHARLQPLVHARRAVASCCRCPTTA